MKRIIKIICIVIMSLISISALVISILYFVKSFNKEIYIGVMSSLLASLLFLFITFLFRNSVVNQLKKLFEKKYIYYKSMKEELVRVSYSYLIRIRVNNKYLLIKSSSIKNIYQPVGGVYHITDDKYIKEKLGFYRDGTPGDPDDIRGIIKGKYIKKFDKWFNKKKDVEIAPYREFNEELIASTILDVELFGKESLKFKYKGAKYEGIKDSVYYSQYAKYELLRYEIYEFIPNEEQLDYLMKLKDKSIYLATSNEIRTLGVDASNNTRRFGTHTNKILED